MLYLILYIVQFGIILYIYRKWGRDEPYLLLKLLGYSVMGSFSFTTNQWSLPLGFIIFLMFFREPAWNRLAKRYAAYLGLFLYLTSLIISPVQNYVYEWPRHVDVSQSLSASEGFDFNEHWNMITHTFGDIHNPRLQRLEMEFTDEGAVESLFYNFKTVAQGNRETNYAVELDLSKKEYEIRRNRYKKQNRQVHHMGQDMHGRISPEEFFKVINETGLEAFTQNKDSHYYSLFAEGAVRSLSGSTENTFMVTTSGIRPVMEEQLPIDAIRMTVNGFKNSEEDRIQLNVNYYIEPRVVYMD
ncbi:hypothetical protein SAMN05216353_13119 [Halobacillus alkaliphilus]|uniref:Uncharacterized protein n=1 Tax=Halobacillus alkaliphilus TaxID=396056 RepID=A0A1I2QD74_9BACI|nr:hypothetical protein [Halobacillus alkaliphilus]SFG26465.1 hypothetical protein SAMN05216353_13119 [Halobacillus alkaliphilus]